MMKCIDRLSKDPILEDNNNQLSVFTGIKQKERKKKKTQRRRTLTADECTHCLIKANPAGQ